MSLLEPFLNKGISFTILHGSGNKDRFIDKFKRSYRDNANTSVPSFKTFEDIPSRSGAFDE